MTVLGLDIGGAHLKAARSSAGCAQLPFELWKDPHGLADALRRVATSFPAAESWAVTMTGELCDCFASKREGVHRILDSVAAAAGDIPVRVWCNDGHFVDFARAREVPLGVAAANWLALATFAGRHAARGASVLIDIGSTTTDIIPIVNGKPAPQGRTDPERLASGDLVYTGVTRTPLCALVDGAAELFATTRDAYLVLGDLPEDPENCRTADGRPATRAAAHARLARMFCADLETSTESERLALAERACRKQVGQIEEALARVVSRLPAAPTTYILSGAGEFLARKVLAKLKVPQVSLSQTLGPEVSQAACAHALVVLAAEADHG